MNMSDKKYPTEAPAGSWAETARLMAEIFPEEDWDRWKDEMKDQEMFEEIEREREGK